MVDTNMLKARIIESGMSVAGVSRESGMLRETFYNRIKSGDFKISEACAISKVLNLSQSERDAIFFAEDGKLKSTH